MGTYFIDQLSVISKRNIQEVQGRGLLIGVGLKKSASKARKSCEALMKLGIVTKNTHEKVIRIAPPLVV